MHSITILERRVKYVAQRFGQDAGERAERGLELFMAGKVHNELNGWYVDSQTNDGISYRVRFYNGDGWQCECQDFRYRAPETTQGRMCKHCYAVKLGVA